jgi:hypothetical protein
LLRLDGTSSGKKGEGFFSFFFFFLPAVEFQEAAQMFRETPRAGDWGGGEELPGMGLVSNLRMMASELRMAPPSLLQISKRRTRMQVINLLRHGFHISGIVPFSSGSR